MSKDLREEIQRLITESLSSPFIGRKLTAVDAASAVALYKRQIERLGCTDVTVSAALVEDGGIAIEARFTPPPAPIEITFTVETKNG